MNVDRTVKLKLDLSEYDKETLKLTMSMSNHVFNEIARYGFENHTCSKVSIHHATTTIFVVGYLSLMLIRLIHIKFRIPPDSTIIRSSK